MLVKKLSVVAVLLFTIGCASNDGLEQQVSTLSNKVDRLTLEVSKLKAQQEKNSNTIDTLKMAQEKTAQRIDNVAASYTK